MAGDLEVFQARREGEYETAVDSWKGTHQLKFVGGTSG